MAQLLAIGKGHASSRSGDVVFVHGLNGDARDTWLNRNKEYWPDWVAEDWPQLAIWSLDYDASASAWFGKSMALSDRAINVLDLLYVNGIGNKPICFVAHSLGGLLVKQMIRHADTIGQSYHNLAKFTRAIVFLATPHAGAQLATLIESIGIVLRPTQVVDELKYDHPRLHELNLWYRSNVQRLAIRSCVLHETRSTHGQVVVNSSSADPGLDGIIPIPVDADHISICKPASKKDHMALKLTQVLTLLYGESQRRTVEYTIDLNLDDQHEAIARGALTPENVAKLLDLSQEMVGVRVRYKGDV